MMLITTTESVSNHKVVKTYGLVRGSSVRARNIGKDILAIFRMIAGGEVSEYSKLLNESRDQALQRMVDSATKLNANAIISTRIVTSTVASGAAEILCYGTAVKIELEN
ncbi:MAG: YbjQ family protein [Dehalococcoidia bacterium]